MQTYAFFFDFLLFFLTTFFAATFFPAFFLTADLRFLTVVDFLALRVFAAVLFLRFITYLLVNKLHLEL